MERWQMRNEGYCPLFTTPQEDTNHILTCLDADSLQGWKENFTQYLANLLKMYTCPILVHALKLDIIAWRYNENPPSLDRYNTSLQRTMLQQRRIEWQHFLEGKQIKHMTTYMTLYYQRTKSMRTGSLWASRAHQFGWELIFATWELRNEQLHNTKRIADMEGINQVNEAIAHKYTLDLGCLPA